MRAVMARRGAGRSGSPRTRRRGWSPAAPRSWPRPTGRTAPGRRGPRRPTRSHRAASSVEHGIVAGASISTLELPAGASIHPAQTGAPAAVTTSAWGPARVTTVAATGCPSSHARSSPGSASVIVAGGGRLAEAISPRPTTRAPSTASARCHARSAASASSGATLRHLADRARSSSAMSHAACGSSGCARSSPSPVARAWSAPTPSRAMMASRARSRRSSTSSAIASRMAITGGRSADGGARLLPCACAQLANAFACVASGGFGAIQTSVAGGSGVMLAGRSSSRPTAASSRPGSWPRERRPARRSPSRRVHRPSRSSRSARRSRPAR